MKTDDGKDIVFLRPDGTPVEYAVLSNCDAKTGEVIFCEIVGYSKDASVQPKPLLLRGREPYNRLFIRRCYPAIKVTE